MSKEAQKRASSPSDRPELRNNWRAEELVALLGLATHALTYFSGAASLAVILGINGFDLNRYLPAPWAWTSTWSLLCLVTAVTWAMFLAARLSILRERTLQNEMSIRRLDALKADVDNTLKELRAES